MIWSGSGKETLAISGMINIFATFSENLLNSNLALNNGSSQLPTFAFLIRISTMGALVHGVCAGVVLLGRMPGR